MHGLFFNNDPEKQHLLSIRPYPDVNTKLFKVSAQKAITLMGDANLVMKKIISSQPFSVDLMKAAQQSDQNRVEALIKSTGIKEKPSIKYSPDGITMNFMGLVKEEECCHIILQLRWE